MGTLELRSAGAPATRFPILLVSAGLVILTCAIAAGRGVAPAAGLLVVFSAVAAGHRVRVRWELVVAFVLLVVLVIPITRYEFAVSLPFELEPYRIVIAILLGIWLTALVVDPRVRPHSSALDGPLLLIALSVIASIALNPNQITHFNVARSFVGSEWTQFVREVQRLPYQDVSTDVTKSLLFFASFFLVYYFIVSVVRSPRAIHSVVKTLVLGTAGIALFAIIERRTDFNVFNHLAGWIPLIHFQGGLSTEDIARTGRLRVLGPAQHPIALAVLFALVLPLSAYLAQHMRKGIWYLTSALMVLGLLATVSRTGIVMLMVIGIVFAALRRDVLRRLWLLLLPAVIAVHILMPGTIGSFRIAFFPPQGIANEQTEFSGRISEDRLKPQFDVIKAKPAFGQGYGSRVTTGPDANSRILDNQWLGTAVETGIVGVLGWLWLFVRFVRRAGGTARRDPSDRGWLLTALASSVAAFGVAMLTYDAFAFIQTSLVFFVLLALGASTLAYEGKWESPAGVDPNSQGRRRTGAVAASARG